MKNLEISGSVTGYAKLVPATKMNKKETKQEYERVFTGNNTFTGKINNFKITIKNK